MSSRNVERLLQEVSALSIEERDELQRRLREAACKDAGSVYAAMKKAGLLLEIPTTRMTQEEFERWQPLPVEGKPVSETIIEERR